MQIQIRAEIMLIDDQDFELIRNLKLRLQPSRNAVYAAFGKNGRVHRLLLGLNDRSLVVDHINGNGLDNRRCNLRVVTPQVNVKNRRVSRSKTNGMPPGMWPYRGKIAVQITDCGKKIFVGYFTCQDEALLALNKARLSLGRPMI